MESKSSTSKHGDYHSSDASREVSNHGSRLNGDGGHSGGHNGGHNGDVAHGYMVNTGLKTDPSNGVDVNASNVEDNGDKGPSRLDGEHNGTPNGSKLPTRSLCVSHESAGAHHDSNALKLVSRGDVSLSSEFSLIKDSIHGAPSFHDAAGKFQEETRASQAKEGDKEGRSQLSHSGHTRVTFLKAKPAITPLESCKSDCLLISGKVSNQLSKNSKLSYSNEHVAARVCILKEGEERISNGAAMLDHVEKEQGAGNLSGKLEEISKETTPSPFGCKPKLSPTVAKDTSQKMRASLSRITSL